MPEFTPNALRVLEARYLLRDEQGALCESPAQLFERVAGAIAGAEALWDGAAEARWRQEFLGLMQRLEFLPNSPTLMNAGTDLGQLSACFVLPVGDSLEEIFDALRSMALVQRSGGGTGFSFSRLRRKGSRLRRTGGSSSGPVSFLKMFDGVAERIREGGKRRGANMGILRVDHPDVLEFVRAKREPGVLENFNLSVGATDAFMQAVADGGRYALVDPRTGRTGGELDARAVFAEIVGAAWACGDPGMVFLDAIEAGNPTPALGAIEATNPCGEVPLLPFESCNLGSINLAAMLQPGVGGEAFDWPRFRRVVRCGVRFLDDVIEVNRYPLPELTAAAQATRKIGLGVMGLAELLVRLRIPYASAAAVALCDELARVLAEEARQASAELAGERGSFPAFAGSRLAGGPALRNATTTSIAPTGTLALIAGTSAGIEPLFALAYRRRHQLGEQTLTELHPLLLRHVRQQGGDAELVLRHGRLTEVPGVAPSDRRLFATALEIPAEDHLAVQAAFQRHVDNAVSKTVNLPQEATEQDVARAYRRAWELRLKGVTIYRYGSKASQVLELGVGEEAAALEHPACEPDECRL